MARLNDLELDAVYERWLKDPNGERTSVHDIYKLTCAAEAEKGGYTADRRAELLELASRLAAANEASDKPMRFAQFLSKPEDYETARLDSLKRHGAYYADLA